MTQKIVDSMKSFIRDVLENMDGLLVFYLSHIRKILRFSFVSFPVFLLIAFFLMINYKYGLNELWLNLKILFGTMSLEQFLNFISTVINFWLGIGTIFAIFSSIVVISEFEIR